MRALSLRGPPIPSTALLRYLKFQTESLRPFAVETSPRSTCARQQARRGICSEARWISGSTPRSRECTHLSSSGAPAHQHLSFPPFPPQSYRSFSCTSSRPQPREVARRSNVWEKWHLKRPSPPGGPEAALLPSPLSDFLDDTSSLGSRLSKPSSDLRLRCTEFDECGNVTLVNGEFKKSELIQKYGLQPRDLRKIDSSLLPTILVRPKAILMNLLHIRCLIQADRVLVFDAYGSTDSYTQSLFMYDLEGKLSLREGRGQGQLPYEFRALEAVLISVTTALEGEFEGVRGPVVKVLRELEENIDRDKLRMLLVLSKKLGTFEQRARLVRDAIDELLEADDDLAAMYLSEKKNGEERSEEDHTEVEMLLESYDKVCDEIVQVSGNLVSNIRNTEEIVKAILDANRNSLMLLDLKFSIGTLGIGAGTFIAALYGMNLKSFIEESDFGFPLVSLTCFVLSVVACVYGLRKLRKVQRVSMWGEGDVSGRYSSKSSSGASSTASRTASSVAKRWWSRAREDRNCADGPPKGSWANVDIYADRPERPDWRRDLDKLSQASREWHDAYGGGGAGARPKAKTPELESKVPTKG
ncbi:cora-domain-containing protein [Myriangium duriaei CBS 260.36]|uniref:Magnesium transporter n=1 Tax=Myriangium duriaei CBS 260.36 TaxID=1168546 RepID=A0A9P4MMZ1_9PEZI|nr:cora-domain-containing protein [Myriangium duriaei CBS 260.36]